MSNIILPIYWNQSNAKTVLVSLNQFRNWHFHTSNKFKREFHELVGKQLGKIVPVQGQFYLDISIYYKNPNCDGANIAALIEKVVLDALQEYFIIVNDNVKYHLGTTWAIAGQDKINPRCEITIHPIEDPNDTTSNQT